MALVSKRFRELCLAPQLLHSLVAHMNQAQRALQSVAALRRFLTAHAAHVQDLTLNVDGPPPRKAVLTGIG